MPHFASYRERIKAMGKKKRVKHNPHEVKTRYFRLSYERARVVGDMLLLADTSEDYQILEKRLNDLNAEIEGLEAKA
jgi:tRNA isopentenyl-2-thiomethyl-A-37 hydroxylase MiaE